MTRAGSKVLPAESRSSGVLLHVTSLPGPYGVGDLGPMAQKWIDLLASAGQAWWQILPLGPVGAANSPYQCYSAFAGYPMLISLDLLVKDGLLTPAEARRARLPAGRVNYPRMTTLKTPLIQLAAERFLKRKSPRMERLQRDQRHWLPDYALFTALRTRYGTADWTTWPGELKFREKDALREALREWSAEIAREQAIQFLFFRQLAQLRAYGREKGVRIIGDMPIFVSAHSSDVWTHPDLFEVDGNLRPKAVAGVPPDLFSTDGQRWGNPLYDWPAMRRTHYAWWIARFRAALLQADLIRLDHFRGFEAYWRIPSRAKTARSGRWVKGPGEHFFQVVRQKLGSLPLIAEDLGVITPAVEALRDQFEFPGMRVVGEFGFSDDAASPHLPHNFVRNCIAYTGTHDNNTVAGWLAHAPASQRKMLWAYAPEAKHAPVWTITRLVEQSVASIAIVAGQDLLSLGAEARMNRPGTDHGNWEWRLQNFDSLPDALARLRHLSIVYGRSATPK